MVTHAGDLEVEPSDQNFRHTIEKDLAMVAHASGLESEPTEQNLTHITAKTSSIVFDSDDLEHKTKGKTDGKKACTETSQDEKIDEKAVDDKPPKSHASASL